MTGIAQRHQASTIISEIEYAHAGILHSYSLYVVERQSQSFANNDHSNKVMAGHYYCSLFMLVNYAHNGWPGPVCHINYTLPTRHFLRALSLSPAQQKLAQTSTELSDGHAFELTSSNLPQIRLNLHCQVMVASNSLGCIQSAL